MFKYIIETYKNKRENQNNVNKIVCPTCKRVPYILGIFEDFRIKIFCFNCKEGKIIEYSNLSPSQNENESNLCKVHNLVKEGVCLNCKTEICIKCQREQHQEHKIIYYSQFPREIDSGKAFNNFKNSFEEIKVEKDKIVKSLKEKIYSLENSYKTFSKNWKTLIEIVQSLKDNYNEKIFFSYVNLVNCSYTFWKKEKLSSMANKNDLESLEEMLRILKEKKYMFLSSDDSQFNKEMNIIYPQSSVILQGDPEDPRKQKRPEILYEEKRKRINTICQLEKNKLLVCLDEFIRVLNLDTKKLEDCYAEIGESSQGGFYCVHRFGETNADGKIYFAAGLLGEIRIYTYIPNKIKLYSTIKEETGFYFGIVKQIIGNTFSKLAFYCGATIAFLEQSKGPEEGKYIINTTPFESELVSITGLKNKNEIVLLDKERKITFFNSESYEKVKIMDISKRCNSPFIVQQLDDEAVFVVTDVRIFAIDVNKRGLISVMNISPSNISGTLCISSVFDFCFAIGRANGKIEIIRKHWGRIMISGNFHEGKVTSLIFIDNYLYSSSSCGKVQRNELVIIGKELFS